MNKFKLIQSVIFFSLMTISYCQLIRKLNPDTDFIVDTQTAVEKWALMESGLKELVQNSIKTLLPLGIEASQSLNISGTCVRDVLKVVSGMKRMKTWAFKFLDASSKSLDGMLSSTSASLGNYDECVENEVIDEKSGGHDKKVLFRGKYCRVEVKQYLPPRPKRIYNLQPLRDLENFTNKDTIIGHFARQAHLLYDGAITLGVCVPSGCSKDDVNQVLKKVSDYVGVVIKSPRCEIKEENKFTPLIIGIITLYSFTVLLVIFGSIIDLYGIYTGKVFKSTGVRIMTSFSFISNFKKLIDTSTLSDTFSCLNGIRTISMIWIIHGHSLYSFTFTLHKSPKAFDLAEDLAMQGIFGSTIAVNTFFFITGTLVCYNVTKMVTIGKKSFNVMMYVFHRIFRIFPAYAYSIVFVFLMPLMASGPVFHYVLDRELESCQKNWWATMLFINNFYDVENMCINTGWYLSLDVQLHIAALIILLPLVWKPWLGVTIAVISIVASMVGSWLSVYLNDLMPRYGFAADADMVTNTFRYYYILPHTHAGSYCVGLLCGYFLAMKPELKIPKAIQILGWCTTTVTTFSIVYGVPKWNGFVEPSFLETLFFSSCTRVAWALCVAWVVVCCGTGHGGIVKYVLTWKMWIPLGRLTFVAYLVHPLIMFLHSASLKTEVLVDFHTDVWWFCSLTAVTYVCSFGGSLFVESPFLAVEKILLSKGGRGEQSSNHCQKHEEITDSTTLSVKVPVEQIVNEEDKEKDTGFENIGFVCRM